MPEASTLQFLFQLAKGIASQFGPNCEVVVHDLDSNDPESSIVAIENGQVTGRKVGDGPVLSGCPGSPKAVMRNFIKKKTGKEPPEHESVSK